jgi:protein arginine N-methyltransferase 2
MARDSSLADLKAFFDVLPDILDGEDASFSFWNGLGATSTSHVPRPTSHVHIPLSSHRVIESSRH